MKKILPLPRGTISRADSRPARKPAQQAISQTLRNTRSVVSRIGKLTLAPTLKMHDFQRRMLVGVVEKGRDLVFLPRVERARDNRSAGGLDIPDQRLELGAVAPACEHGKSFGGEFLGDLGADIIAGADHRDRCVALLHCHVLQ